MKSSPKSHRILRSLSLAATLALTGCYSIHTSKVPLTVLAPNVLDATLPQLLTRLATQDEAIQTLNASVDIMATTGGQHEGEVKETPTFAGYIFLRRPADLRVLMLVPVLRSRALDMVSDGKDFKLLIPSKNKAVIGSDEFSATSRNGLENLRPYIIREALLIPTATPDQYTTLSRGSRIIPPLPGKKVATEEPDYDVTILRIKQDHVLEKVRVIHFGRVTLEPYQQDIYDNEGRIATTITYGKYQKYGDIDYPSSIVLIRPVDEYKLKIDVTKMVFNGKLDDLQFALKIPDGVVIQKM